MYYENNCLEHVQDPQPYAVDDIWESIVTSSSANACKTSVSFQRLILCIFGPLSSLLHCLPQAPWEGTPSNSGSKLRNMPKFCNKKSLTCENQWFFIFPCFGLLSSWFHQELQVPGSRWKETPSKTTQYGTLLSSCRNLAYNWWESILFEILPWFGPFSSWFHPELQAPDPPDDQNIAFPWCTNFIHAEIWPTIILFGILPWFGPFSSWFHRELQVPDPPWWSKHSLMFSLCKLGSLQTCW